MVKGFQPGSTTPSPLPPGDYAFFLDFDGTLVAIAPHPDQVQVTPRLQDVLRKLQDASGGALAVVSGRAIEVLDRLLGPVTFSAAGIHGAEYRHGSGPIEKLPVKEDALAQAKQAAKDFAQQHAGVLYEEKSVSFALHYRQATDFAADVDAFMERLIADHQADFELQRGKMVIELKPRGSHKGAAIERFMHVEPFKSRVPVYLGDDVTDEDAFRTVNEHGGISVKVGPGDTVANLRLESTNAVLDWLEQLANALPGADLAVSSGASGSSEGASRSGERTVHE